MADLADRAEKDLELQDMLLDQAIERLRLKPASTLGPLFCSCGEEIAYVRRKLGLRQCIECAHRDEKRR